MKSTLKNDNKIRTYHKQEGKEIERRLENEKRKESERENDMKVNKEKGEETKRK